MMFMFMFISMLSIVVALTLYSVISSATDKRVLRAVAERLEQVDGGTSLVARSVALASESSRQHRRSTPSCVRCTADLGWFNWLRASKTRMFCNVCCLTSIRAHAAFRHILTQITNDKTLDPSEETALRAWQFRLGLTDADVACYMPFIERARWFYRVSQGELPVASASGVNLRADEVCHVFEAAVALEERTERRYQAGSRGVSVRLMKGVTFRVGSSQGRSIPHTEYVSVGDGTLLVTNRRTLFLGPRTIEIPHKHVLCLEPWRDGFEMAVEGRQRPHMFYVTDGEATAAILAFASANS